jgi:DNA-binding NtrC family response regulator
VPLALPPLRERRHDIPILVHSFLQKFLAEEKRADLILSSEVMDALLAHDWPGNIRELQNVIRYLLVHCRETIASIEHLPPNLLAHPRTIEVASRPRSGSRPALTRAAVEQALAASSNNRVQAAKILGISRATLYRFFDKKK